MNMSKGLPRGVEQEQSTCYNSVTKNPYYYTKSQSFASTVLNINTEMKTSYCLGFLYGLHGGKVVNLPTIHVNNKNSNNTLGKRSHFHTEIITTTTSNLQKITLVLNQMLCGEFSIFYLM